MTYRTLTITVLPEPVGGYVARDNRSGVRGVAETEQEALLDYYSAASAAGIFDSDDRTPFVRPLHQREETDRDALDEQRIVDAVRAGNAGELAELLGGWHSLPLLTEMQMRSPLAHLLDLLVPLLLSESEKSP